MGIGSEVEAEVRVLDPSLPPPQPMIKKRAMRAAREMETDFTEHDVIGPYVASNGRPRFSQGMTFSGCQGLTKPPGVSGYPL
jgi:hypothetical protein